MCDNIHVQAQRDVQVTTVSTCRKSVADSESESVLLNNDAAIDWAIQSNKLHAVH